MTTKQTIAYFLTAAALFGLSQAYVAYGDDRVTNDDGIRFYNCGPYGIEIGAMDEPFINSDLADWLCREIELLGEDKMVCTGTMKILKNKLVAAKKLLKVKKAKR